MPSSVGSSLPPSPGKRVGCADDEFAEFVPDEAAPHSHAHPLTPPQMTTGEDAAEMARLMRQMRQLLAVAEMSQNVNEDQAQSGTRGCNTTTSDAGTHRHDG